MEGLAFDLATFAFSMQGWTFCRQAAALSAPQRGAEVMRAAAECDPRC